MLSNFLNRQIDIAPLVFFRIVFGALGFLDVIGVWIYYHLYKDAFNPNNLQIKYYGFEWVQTMPDPWLSLAFWVTAIAAIGITLGKWYRLSTIVFALGFSYIYFLEKCNYLNHGYLFCVLSYLMIFLPANRAFALDIKTNPKSYSKYIARWPILLLQFLMAVVYIFGGIAKVNSDWLRALPLRIWLPYKKDYFLIGNILEQEWVAWLMSYGGLLHDLFIIPFMLFKRTRVIAFIICCAFHLTNTAVFQIGIFPWMSIALTAMFFPPDFPRKLIDYLAKKVNIIEKWAKQYQEHLSRLDVSTLEQLPAHLNAIGIISIGFFFIIQICMPLRHHVYPNHVAWTEEGHRYSWRMMLRGKTGSGYFHVKDLTSDKEVKKLYAKEYLTTRQNRKYKSHPDMILFVAHHIRDIYREKWGTDAIAIYPHFKVKLNGRNYQALTDSSVDLALEEWSWTKSWSWILPYDENDFPEKYAPKNKLEK